MMLTVTIHSSTLADRKPTNTLAILHIAYKELKAWGHYSVHFSLKGVGEVQSAELVDYPRWSASLWDLVARSLALILYRTEAIAPIELVDRRCAYATRMCAVIERSTASDTNVELGTFEIAQQGDKRGHYSATFTEDILGERTANFTYGLKSLQHADLLLRAICYALEGKDTLGARPPLIVPAYVMDKGVNVFDVNALPQPTRTGFDRYRRAKAPGSNGALPSVVKLDEYLTFMAKG
jgi:hypothetical protein